MSVAQTVSSHPPTRRIDRGRAFVSDHPLRSLRVDGGPAFAVKVRLTSYRSLPLSCLQQISLRLDGEPIESDRIRFVLDSHSYRLDELTRHSTVWWFILDHAELVFTVDQPLAVGEHRIEGTLVTVEPYVSNGRFYFTSTASRTLHLEESGSR